MMQLDLVGVFQVFDINLVNGGRVETVLGVHNVKTLSACLFSWFAEYDNIHTLNKL